MKWLRSDRLLIDIFIPPGQITKLHLFFCCPIFNYFNSLVVFLLLNTFHLRLENILVVFFFVVACVLSTDHRQHFQLRSGVRTWIDRHLLLVLFLLRYFFAFVCYVIVKCWLFFTRFVFGHGVILCRRTALRRFFLVKKSRITSWIDFFGDHFLGGHTVFRTVCEQFFFSSRFCFWFISIGGCYLNMTVTNLGAMHRSTCFTGYPPFPSKLINLLFYIWLLLVYYIFLKG